MSDMTPMDDAHLSRVRYMVDDALANGERITTSGAPWAALIARLDASEARAAAAERERDELRAAQQWQPIETAPKDGTPFIGTFLNPPWRESHLRGEIVQVWWQPQFDAFISGAREMTLAPGYSFEDGSSRQLHSPEVQPVDHWMPYPAPPQPR